MKPIIFISILGTILALDTSRKIDLRPYKKFAIECPEKYFMVKIQALDREGTHYKITCKKPRYEFVC
eukprot:01597.XXX_6798_6431_1 [CDS] Oithona nana genome sequencing.